MRQISFIAFAIMIFYVGSISEVFAQTGPFTNSGNVLLAENTIVSDGYRKDFADIREERRARTEPAETRPPAPENRDEMIYGSFVPDPDSAFVVKLFLITVALTVILALADSRKRRIAGQEACD